MKRILKRILGNIAALYVVITINTGFRISGSWSVFIYSAIILMILNSFVRPILNFLFLPINLITLGVFSWVFNIITLYLLTRFVSEITISEWRFPGINSYLVNIPSISFSMFANFIIISFMLSFIERFLHWLYD